MKLKLIAFLSVSTSLLSGCCTMFNPAEHPVKVDSLAPVKFRVVRESDNVTVTEGTTPTTITVNQREAPYRVQAVNSDGKYVNDGEIKSVHSSNWEWGNVLTLNLGDIPDVITKSYQVLPDSFRLTDPDTVAYFNELN
jgi:hypothetical protein